MPGENRHEARIKQRIHPSSQFHLRPSQDDISNKELCHANHHQDLKWSELATKNRKRSSEKR